jgi:NAD(P)-dependent dehydrogenase (short-subunit alcohol dehydrogenase family)
MTLEARAQAAPSPFSLDGKVAVVTGSSRGIGRASAEAMARLGARVVISSRKAEACEAVAGQIRQWGGEAAVIPCNVSRKPEVEALVAGTLRTYGRIDILVCNAAVNPVYGPLGELTDEAFDKVMGTNVKSNLWLCNLVIPGMAKRRDGAVIIVSSIAGLHGTSTLGAYGISKAADFALARNLAVEWGPHEVRVNCVAPGWSRPISPALCGTIRSFWRGAPPPRRCAASANPKRSARWSHFWRRRVRASSPARSSSRMVG